jgi:hypothetical protein
MAKSKSSDASKMMKKISAPAIVALAFGLLGLLGTLFADYDADPYLMDRSKVGDAIGQVVVAALIAFLAQYAFTKGYTKTAWVLALLPVIFGFLLILLLVGAVALTPISQVGMMAKGMQKMK